jgi:hypothetical protein
MATKLAMVATKINGNLRKSVINPLRSVITPKIPSPKKNRAGKFDLLSLKRSL